MSVLFEKGVHIDQILLEEIPTGTLLRINEEGMGVAAPLVGYSYESKAQAKEQLKSLCTHLIGHSISPEEAGRLPLFPSAVFALQSALLPPASTDCAIQGLLVGDEIPDCSVLKVKVGDSSVEEVLQLVEKLPMRLRLDFNQKWELDEAIALASKISWERVEYFEEPLKDPTDLSHFPYPVALDETLRMWPLEKIASFNQVVALVIKPTLLGDVLPFARQEIPLVLSSCFEGIEGIECLARLANHLGIADRPHGLDTLKCITH